MSDIARGENSGRKLQHDFVVLAFTTQPLTSAKPEAFATGPLDLASATGDPPGAIVAWVGTGDGSIAQIAGGWLASPAN